MWLRSFRAARVGRRGTMATSPLVYVEHNELVDLERWISFDSRDHGGGLRAGFRPLRHRPVAERSGFLVSWPAGRFNFVPRVDEPGGGDRHARLK